MKLIYEVFKFTTLKGGINTYDQIKGNQKQPTKNLTMPTS